MNEAIPTIDVAPLLNDGDDPATIRKIGDACRDLGFLCISGTGVPEDLVKALRNEISALFVLPEAVKQSYRITRENYRGYVPLGFFSPNDGTGTADHYEAYKLHVETDECDPVRQQCALYGPNRWPQERPQLKRLVLEYWRQLDRINAALVGALARNLDLPVTTFRDAFETPLTNMTLLHYPPAGPDQSGFGIHPHKDTDALTIIAPDPVGGLEIKSRSGGWLEPDCPPDGFVVNIGDMFELWSGGRFTSTPHRVTNRSGKERYSFPYFAVPRHDVVVRPLVGPLPGFEREPVHCGHWSAEIWRTNWPDEMADATTPELGTLHL